jgi:hypothetical protein
VSGRQARPPCEIAESVVGAGAAAAFVVTIATTLCARRTPIALIGAADGRSPIRWRRIADQLPDVVWFEEVLASPENVLGWV